MQFYTIPKSKVIYEILNMEVIAIDFDTGNYYALVHVAKQIWCCLEKGFSKDEIADLLAQHYQKDLKEIFRDVDSFFEQLLKNGLIEKAQEGPDLKKEDLILEPWGYEPPTVQIYTDVQNLLLIDPIHEVTEAGWPEQVELNT